MKLTDLTIRTLTQPGRFTDDLTKGLHLWVKGPQHRYWNFRYTFEGARKTLSLGSYPEISLRLARERATEARASLNRGIDPMPTRKRPTASTAGPANTTGELFGPFAIAYINRMRPRWRNATHAGQWVSTVTRYAGPVIGDLRLEQIDTPHILAILEPIWNAKPETASRLRGRLESILAAAITQKLRPANNPALWRGHLEHLLPARQKSYRHHCALPYADLPALMTRLANTDGVAALALQFAILNASRSGEVLMARRSEVVGNVWTIPGPRMKAGREHQVPLCRRSLELLSIARADDPRSEYLFSRRAMPLSNMSMAMLLRRLVPGPTVHGFRSCFRDWVSEETEHSPEVAEMALSHVIGNKVEAAYRRGKLLEKRRRLMQDWENFCLKDMPSSVVPIRSEIAA